jgi:superfamily II DNA or RNA helicase
MEENGKFITLWEEKKSLGQKKTKEEAIRKITDNRYTINLISAVRALNEGIDIPDLEEALIHSRDSVARTIVQRTGRVARLFKYKNGELKKPLIVNFYLKRTKDEDWLKKSMKNMPGIIWIDGIEELNNFVNKTEDDFAFIDELLN